MRIGRDSQAGKRRGAANRTAQSHYARGIDNQPGRGGTYTVGDWRHAKGALPEVEVGRVDGPAAAQVPVIPSAACRRAKTALPGKEHAAIRSGCLRRENADRTVRCRFAALPREEVIPVQHAEVNERRFPAGRRRHARLHSRDNRVNASLNKQVPRGC